MAVTYLSDVAPVNAIHINYRLDKQSNPDAETIVLVNGLADDMNAWFLQVSDFVAAGYSVLYYDNRGIGQSSSPAGPYDVQMLATDLYELLRYTGIHAFHLLGVSMGGMIAQQYALSYPNGSANAQGHHMLSLSLCCTYAEPTTFCSRMFGLWADMAVRMSVQDVMRDVILWCFTLDFFRRRSAELEETDMAMQNLSMTTEAYLSQLNVIRQFDSTKELSQLSAAGKSLGELAGGKIMVLAGEDDILIPVGLSRELHKLLPGSKWSTCRGGHACSLEYSREFNMAVLEFLTGGTRSQ